MTNNMHNSYKQFFIAPVFLAARLASTVEPNGVIQYIRQYSWWWTSNSFETCKARKNGGIKAIYKNCAFHWSSTHCNMTHGTHNVKKENCTFPWKKRIVLFPDVEWTEWLTKTVLSYLRILCSVSWYVVIKLCISSIIRKNNSVVMAMVAVLKNHV